jgi:hypothetical protein
LFNLYKEEQQEEWKLQLKDPLFIQSLKKKRHSEEDQEEDKEFHRRSNEIFLKKCTIIKAFN